MENLELFDNYINQALSREDRASFEKRLADDDGFKASFEEYELLVSGIELAGANSLKDKLAEHEAGYQNKTASKSIVYKIAAGLIIFAIASFLIIQYSIQDNYGDLYTEYYSPYPNVIDPVNRSEQSTGKSTFQLYESRKFQEVIAAINPNQATDDELFYLSQSYLAVNDFNNALKIAEQVDINSRFYDAAQWYLALIYLAKEDSSALHTQLEKIIHQADDYKRQAKSLQEDL